MHLQIYLCKMYFKTIKAFEAFLTKAFMSVSHLSHACYLPIPIDLISLIIHVLTEGHKI
jgi:hypothetical protein